MVAAFRALVVFVGAGFVFALRGQRCDVSGWGKPLDVARAFWCVAAPRERHHGAMEEGG